MALGVFGAILLVHREQSPVSLSMGGIKKERGPLLAMLSAQPKSLHALGCFQSCALRSGSDCPA